MSLWSVLECAMQVNGSGPALTRQDGSIMQYAELLEYVKLKARKIGKFIPAGSKVAVMDEHPFYEAVHVLAFIMLQVTIIPMTLKYGEQRCAQIIRHTEPDFLYTSQTSIVTEILIEACKSAGTMIIADQAVC
ncbi:long-chain fatty acid--CoA ligase [Paenibacillus sp. N3.4]|uniref:long-chain fatty acid--CoA ligase n=1 Tax=Paenibacillus sp. N3.4 TaxID=2603222 RepID=UPI0011C6FD26|nr:long-chain fatty acid--CoA ligase [Paenibacillus sp. N3.4]TXK77428.1 long-chain fatty acid--CoA ligase [Paenibacillus sp. N3.4]